MTAKKKYNSSPNDQIYSDGTYLAKNATWDQEHSAYKANEVGRLLNKIQFRSVIEVGCGAGKIIELLALEFPNVRFVGYDISNDAAGFWGLNRISNLIFICGDILETDDHADIVLCLDVFEHVSDYLGFLEQLKKHGTYFIFKIPIDLSVLKLITGGLERARSDVGHLHYFNEATALATLKDCGYEIEYSQLSPAFLKVRPDNIRQWLVFLPRLLSHYILGRRLACKFFGGYGLMVRAKC